MGWPSGTWASQDISALLASFESHCCKIPWPKSYRQKGLEACCQEVPGGPQRHLANRWRKGVQDEDHRCGARQCGAQEEEDRGERQSSLGKTPFDQNPDTQIAQRGVSDSESWHSDH